MRRIVWAVVISSACVRSGPVAPPPPAPQGPELIARAVMPADTFAAGPPSGRVLNPDELRGRSRPFASQPVQGFSALLPDGDAGFFGLSDNGYGAPETSADYRLRIYRLRPDFARGVLAHGGFIELSDPHRHVPFPLVHEWTDAGRVLTGADFDPESFQPDSQGGFWLGDELGPYLLHVDGEGRVVEPPISLPDLYSPYHARYEEAAALKVMNALAAHALAHGAPVPLVSPWHLLVADADPLTAVPSRADSGVSSELFDVAALKKAGFEVVPWTVNDPGRAARLRELGVSNVISDRPDLVPGAQGHRGARGLRPENTLAAFEAALELGVSTLEGDLLLTKDGVPVLGHDPVLEPEKCRIAKPVAVRELTAAQVTRIVCDRRPLAFPDQRAPPGGSYTMPTLEQLLLRMKREPVRFNLEIKHEPVKLTEAAVAVIRKHGLSERVDLQSFDLSALLHVHRVAPELRTIALFADLPGLNLEPGAGLLAGLPWPHRSTYAAAPPRVRVSGGFEAMARDTDGTLWPMLEKPLEGGAHVVHSCAFDPRSSRYTGRCFDYPLDARAVAATDFQFSGRGRGLVLERDDTQGDPAGFKRIFGFKFPELDKRELVNLNALETKLPGAPADFPFWTVESALPLPGGRLAVMNDDNYPFSCGRHVDAGEPDDSELVIVQLP